TRLPYKTPPHSCTDELDYRVEVELLRKSSADFVDDGQLRGPFFGLREEVLRLGEQAGVLEGDAHARGQCAQQALVRFSEAKLLEPLEPNHPQNAFSGEDRHSEPRFGELAPNRDGPMRA